MIKNIFIIDNAKSILDVPEEILKDNSNLMLSLSADASWHLEKLKVSYKIPYDCYDFKILREMNEKLYDDTSNICSFLDRYFRKHSSFIRNENILIGQSLFQPIKVALNSILHRLINIESVRNNYHDVNFIHYHDPEFLDRKYQYFKKFNTIYKRLINSRKGIIINSIQSSSSTHNQVNRRFNFSKFDILFYYNKLKSIYFSKVHKKKSHNTLDGLDKIKFYILDNSYSIYDLGEFGAKRGEFELIRLNQFQRNKDYDESLSVQHKEICEQLICDNDFLELFNYHNINVLSLFKDIFSDILFEGVLETLIYYCCSNKMLSQNERGALILPTISYPKQWACAHVAKNKNIPVFVWQHGCYATLDPHSPPIHFDIKNSDYFLSFGESVKKAFEVEAKKYNTSIIAVGSSRLDSIRKTKQRKNSFFLKKKTVLMPLRGIDVSYLGDSYQVYPPDIYWGITKRILSIFKNYTDLDFVIKLYPVNKILDNPISNFIQHNKIKNVDVISRPGFSDLLPFSDLIIIDWPYTTLLEAAQAKKNIICLNQHWTLRAGVHALLKKRCYMAETIEAFTELMNTYNSGHLPKLCDNEFLEQYGIYKSDQKATERALKTIKEIVNSK